MIFWKNEMVAHQMVPVATLIPLELGYCFSNFQMGQGWHEDPSRKDAKLGLPLFPHKKK